MGGDLNEKLYILHLPVDPRARLELTFEFEYDPGDALMDDFRVTLEVRSELKEESGEGEQKNSKLRNLHYASSRPWYPNSYFERMMEFRIDPVDSLDVCLCHLSDDDQRSPDPSRVATIINIFLSKQKYFMINIRVSCRIRWAVGASWKIRPILHKRIFSAPVTSQSRCQIVYEIKTNDLCVKCGNFVNFPLFCNKLFSLSWGE